MLEDLFEQICLVSEKDVKQRPIVPCRQQAKIPAKQTVDRYTHACHYLRVDRVELSENDRKDGSSFPSPLTEWLPAVRWQGLELAIKHSFRPEVFDVIAPNGRVPVQGVEHDHDGLSLFYLVATAHHFVLFRSNGPSRSRAFQTQRLFERRVDVFELLQMLVANRLAPANFVDFGSNCRVGTRSLE